MESPISAVASRVASTNSRRVGAERVADRVVMSAARELPVGLRVNVAGHRLVRVDHRAGLRPARIFESASVSSTTTMSQPSTRSASPAAMRTAWMSSGRRGDADVGGHRAALLRQAGHVEHAAALALEVRRHAEQRADGDHAGAADAGDQDAVGLARAPACAGSGSVGEARLGRDCALRLAQRAALHGDEARAEALDAGVILVAGRLVDRALAAELGFHRQHRQAVRLHAAVAAAFAHRSLMTTRLAGSAIMPRLRRRRFSAAQVWS